MSGQLGSYDLQSWFKAIRDQLRPLPVSQADRLHPASLKHGPSTGRPGKLRIHDLTHTFAGHTALSKETLPIIGRLLGHANHQSTARYAHLDDEHLLGAAPQVGDAVEKLLASQPQRALD